MNIAIQHMFFLHMVTRHFFVVFSVKKTQEMTQGNFQKDIPLFCSICSDDID